MSDSRAISASKDISILIHSPVSIVNYKKIDEFFVFSLFNFKNS